MAAARPPRRLFLHLSALSDTEYTVYIDALRDLLEDDDPDRPVPRLPDDELERRTVGLREVRAWMKGRFRDIGTGEIDKVLQLFTPQLTQKEMSGGQLLAALRLLMHARHGGEIGEGNVFVQAEPSSPTLTRSMNLPGGANIPLEADLPTPDLPASPEARPKSSRTNPFLQELESSRQDFSTSTSLPQLHASVSTVSGSDSAQAEISSLRRASLSSAPPRPPASSKPRMEGMGVPPGTTNPFLHRARTHTGTPQNDRTPPLPPRKPSHMSKPSATLVPPPLPAKPHTSAANKPTQPMKSSSSSALNHLHIHGPAAPAIPPHRITPLMQQSLLASRQGASLKRAKDEADRTRVLEVIRSSSSRPSRTTSTSRSPDKGVRRPVPKPPRMLPASSSASSSRSDISEPRTAFSIEEVAAARLGRSARSPFEQSRSRSRSPPESAGTVPPDNDTETPTASKSATMAEHFAAPPTHPARRPSGRAPSTTARMHHRTSSYHAYHSSNVPQSPFSASGATSPPKTAPAHSTSVSPISPNTSRSGRSQSMHQPSSPNPLSDTDSKRSGRQSPPLPPPRRRPESMQFPPSGRALSSPTDGGNVSSPDLGSPFVNSFSSALEKRAAIFDNSDRTSFRHTDTREKDSSRERANAFTSLQRTFSALSDRVQPTLTRARYKAEAGLAPRRGFVPNGPGHSHGLGGSGDAGELELFHPLASESADRLMDNEDDEDEAGAGMDPDYLELEDEEGRGRADEIGLRTRTEAKPGGTGTTWDEDEETVRGRGRGLAPGRYAQLRERDNLKLPEGEGWAPL